MKPVTEPAWLLIERYFIENDYQPGQFTVLQNLMRHFENYRLTGGDAEAAIERYVEIGLLIRSLTNPSQIALANKR